MSGAPQTQRIVRREELDRIDFGEDGMAAVMAPASMLDAIRFKNDHREESPRLEAVRRSIMDRGYDPTEPIVVRIGQKGKWIVVDGGHRITAVREICGSWWRRLLSKRVGDLYFLLFLTPRSFAKSGPPPSVAAPELPAAEAAALLR